MSTNRYADVLPSMVTTSGRRLEQLSKRQPVLLVFLRYFGCVFCQEALRDLAERNSVIRRLGSLLVLVHMSDSPTAERYFPKYDLAGVEHVSDPHCRFYEAFGLTKGTARQLLGLQTLIRGFKAGGLHSQKFGARHLGDGFQMPGVFVLRNGQVTEKFIHKLAADRPQYVDLLTRSFDPVE